MGNAPTSRERDDPRFFAEAFADLPAPLARREPPEWERLPGDASNRRFYRARWDPDTSLILMVLADPDPHRQPAEEFTGNEEPAAEIPFLNIHRYLRKIGIPVPEVVHHDADRGIIYLEDLGDTLLYDLTRSSPPAEWSRHYDRAVELLVTLQSEAMRNPDAGCLAFHRRFDASLFEWEFQHFREEILSPAGRADAGLTRECRHISRELAGEPPVLCHRDYHSRNLMLAPRGISLIDFQDALLALRQYDLASLLGDAYVELSDATVDRLLGRYLEGWGRAGNPPEDIRRFRRGFDLACVQRGLKAAGRFAYIHRVKQNPKFLVFIPGILHRARKLLDGYPEFPALAAALERDVPDRFR